MGVKLLFLLTGACFGFLGGIFVSEFNLLEQLRVSLFKPEETLLKCESVGSNRPDFLKITDLGSENAEIFLKEGASGFRQLNVTWSDEEEIRWTDGWGYNLGREPCPKSQKFCATEKVMPIFLMPDRDSEYYLVEQVALYDCCGTEYHSGEWVAKAIPMGTDIDRQIFCYDITPREP